MFLHSGASLHGHEYSSPPPQNRPPLRIPYLRSALRQMSDHETNTTYSTPRRLSFQDEEPNAKGQASSSSSRPESFIESPGTPTPEVRAFRPRPKSESFSRSQHVVRFAEPESDADEPRELREPREPSVQPRSDVRSPTVNWAVHSEDESAYSELSDGNSTLLFHGRKKRRTPRSAMRYLVAQPPGYKHRRFIHVRPKLLLQLQQLTEPRPKPAFDALSSSILRGSLIGTRLSKRFPRLLGLGSHLGPDDVIIAESEDYDSEGSDDDNNDPLGSRELLAVISPRLTSGFGCTDVVLADGSIWTASILPNGSYEFVHINEEGRAITARWVKRRIAFEDEEHYKFTFSIIDPTSRRHPIMGTLTQSTLEVLNHYTTVSPHSSARHPPTRPYSFDANGASPIPLEERTSERTILPVDQRTRTFITVSAMWISLQQLGIISATPRNCPNMIAPPSTTSLPTQQLTRSRRVSTPLPPVRAPTPQSNGCGTCQPTAVPPSPAVSISPSSTMQSQPPQQQMSTTEMKRASSTGAAFMRRRMAAPPEKRKSMTMPDDGFGDGVAEPPAKVKLYTRIKKALGFKKGEPER